MAKALVVDDSKTIRTILARTLKEIGFEVLEAANGREALEAVSYTHLLAIEAAVYPQEELSRLPQGILEKYFEEDGRPGYLRVIDKVRRLSLIHI